MARTPAPPAALVAPTTPPGAPGRGVLSFQVGEQTCAVDVSRVREIRRFEAPTRISGTRADVLGLIDLRGTVVPVIDLRLRLGSGAGATSETTSVVVVEIGGHLVGAVVDAVHDVVDLSRAAMHAVPPVDGGRPPAHLRALATVDGQMLLLLDTDALLGDTVAPRH